MRRSLSVLFALGLLLAMGSNAFAHFLFIKIGAEQDGQRSIEVLFGLSTREGAPQFLEKIANTQLWLLSSDGKKVPIKLKKDFDRLVGTVPSRKAMVIEGRCQYGVVKRNEPFLLKYYPKTIAGDPEALNQIGPSGELPLEVSARVKGSELVLTALGHGKPLPGEILYVVDAELNSSELPSDERGTVTWKPPADGAYTIYIGRETKQAGELDGEPYTSIREFGTLGILWPLGDGDPGEEQEQAAEKKTQGRLLRSQEALGEEQQAVEQNPSSGVLFTESFDDDQLLSRGMYDGRNFRISSTDAYAGSGCIEFRWKDGDTRPSPSSGFRRLFPPRDEVYLRFYLKLSPNWGWSGRSYHPHLINLMTTENSKYHGPAASHLTLYVEPMNGKLRLAATDIQNKDAPHGLTQGPLRGGYNAKLYDSKEVLFDDAEWHLVEAIFKLNSLDRENDKPNADGVLRGWFDGELVIERTDVVFRSTDFPEMQLNQFLLLPYFGTGLLPHAQTLWIDELAVGTRRLGPASKR